MRGDSEVSPGSVADPVDRDDGVASGVAAASLRVVGIASSAGGLEALRELFEGLPASDRLSYVVAQHMSPTHVSSLAELLAPHTRLPIADLEPGDVPRPGTIRLIPPDCHAELVDGRFRLVKQPNAIGPKPSANLLFQSLADGLGEAAVGIVLSGTGSDGASGVRDIKAAGGLTIVQDPATAKHDGMPRSAIRTGSVDLVLHPGDIGPTLWRLVERSADAGEAAGPEGDGEPYARIAQLVRVRTAFKLDEYKAATVRRRIARRIGLLNLPSLAAYVEHLRATPDEAQQLVRDTFISVTSFFRDGEAWRALERAVGALVREASSGMLRCWVPGCATGEEAYGIAMLFEEALRIEQRADLQYMVFASDLDDDALDLARHATYVSHAVAQLPEPLRERYVDLDGDAGRVRKDLRARVVFARQNVIDDPPFSRMDLISCRNLLIYLNPPVQRRVLELFHYALRTGGRLFLGRSEALDGHADLFAPIELPARLYQRLEGFKRRAPPWRQPDATVDPTVPPSAERRTETHAEAAVRRMHAQLARRHAPPTLLLDEADDVLRFEGALKPFLDFPSGGGMHLFDMADASIRAELRALVYRCRRDRTPVQGAGHVRHVDGVPHDVRVHIEPLADDASGLLLVSFIARPKATAPAAPAPQPGAREAAIVAELERELADTREHLVIVVDELQAANERLRAANEEQQSANEELQSTNEELRTVNEELQSANEELLTVNEELEVKSGELEASASLLTNIKQSLDFPLLVVDTLRRVLDANRACRQLVHHDAALQGLSVHALAWRFPIGTLDDELQRVFDGGERTVRELNGEAGQHFRLHVMPYRTGRLEIVGAVLLFEDVTALRGAEDRYRQVTESLPQLVWTCLADGPCDYLSPQWVAYTGIPEAEQLGFGWLERLHPDDQQRVIDRWTETAAKGLDLEIEFRIRRHDGEYRWFHTLARPLRDAQGAIVKWYGSNTDIDDRRRAEAALKIAADTLEQRVAVRTAELERTTGQLAQAVHDLEDLYHNAPCGYHSIDAEGRILRVNDTELRWLGYTREEMVGRRITELLAPAGRATFAANYPRLRAGQTLSNLEVDWLRKDGSELPMLVSATPVFDDQGRYLHSRSVLLDHTLPRAQQRTLRSILTAAPMAVRIARLSDHRVLFVNQAYTELVKRSAEEALGLDARRFYVDPAAFDDIVRRLSAGEAVRNELVELCRPEDPTDHRWALASFMSIDYEGQRAALAWLFDVTELQQARRLAEESSQAKSLFLANMSHEIRTPLNGVLGLAQIGYRDSFGRGKAQTTFARILDSGRLLLTIVNDILDFSKIEAGKLAIESVPFDPAQLVEQVVQGVAEQASAKSLPLATQLHALPPAALGDPMRIAQILYNLVSNAVKFTERGEVRLLASTEAGPEGPRLTFTVRDTGIGIEASMLDRLFEPFEQADGSFTRRFGGTGLGLAISRRLAVLMGGRIDVQSAPGQGSSFMLRLPLRATDRPAPMPRDLALGGTRRLAGLNLLVAEDNAVNQMVIEELLRGEGAEVTLADDGHRAVECVVRSARAFDAVLMDVQMPRMDGIDATVALARTHPGLPVIGQTAHALKEEADRCLAAGMVATVQKPIDLDLLVSTLLEHVRPGVGGGSTTPGAPLPEAGPPALPVIDWSAMHRRYDGRRAFVERLARLFVERHTAFPAQLRAAAAAEDFHAIKLLAHELKSSAGNVGAAGLERLAATAMESAHLKNRDAFGDAGAVASELERAIDALRAGPTSAPSREDLP